MENKTFCEARKDWMKRSGKFFTDIRDVFTDLTLKTKHRTSHSVSMKKLKNITELFNDENLARLFAENKLGQSDALRILITGNKTTVCVSDTSEILLCEMSLQCLTGCISLRCCILVTFRHNADRKF